MNNRIISVLTFVIFSLISMTVSAQRIATGKGTYTYPVPESKSIEEAKIIATEKARLQVIADKFGTIVDMSTMTEVRNVDEVSSIEMISYGESEVKGEWIEDISEPVFSINYENEKLYITVTVEGKIREIVSADIDFMARVLRNGTEDHFEDYDFKEGDDFYLSFVSPVDGYLAVYMYNGDDDAYCLLPYMAQSEGCFGIKRNRRYVLFSSEKASDGIFSNIVDEYRLTASSSKEVNLIYIIFSPNKFVKALDAGSDENLPRNLDYRSFQKWLIKSRNRDKEMRVQRKTITISK